MGLKRADDHLRSNPGTTAARHAPECPRRTAVIGPRSGAAAPTDMITRHGTSSV